MSIAELRLVAQKIECPDARTPAETVRALLAMQAQDFAASQWAVGLRSTGATLADVERAITAGTILRSWPMRGTLHLTAAEDLSWMPAFDEYALGYRDRSAVLHIDHKERIVPGGNGMFLPMVVANGQVVGTWRRRVKAHEVIVDATPFTKWTLVIQRGIASAVEKYGAFLGLPARLG